MKKLKNSPITTIFGGILLLSCLGLVAIDKATLSETSGWMALGGTLLGANDKMFKSEK